MEWNKKIDESEVFFFPITNNDIGNILVQSLVQRNKHVNGINEMNYLEIKGNS